MFAALRSYLPVWLQRLLLVLLALAFVWSAGMLWVPWLLKPLAERGLQAATGRSAHVGTVEFRPWSLELSVRDVSVRTQDGSADQLHVARIYVDAAVASVWHLAPVLDALAVDQPRLTVRQQAPGRYDIDDILARLAAPSEQPPGPPPAFALYNLSLADGSVDFQDEVVGRLHTVRGLQLGLPFLSNLPADRESHTEPRLAFKVNGSAFDSSARSTPFLPSRKTTARLAVGGFDVGPYLAYWPKGLPVQLQAGVLQADLELQFEQQPVVSAVVRGQLGLRGLQLSDAADGRLLQIERLGLEVAEFRPLERSLRLASLDIDAPTLEVRRDAQGRLNLWAAAAAGTDAPAHAAPAAPAAATPVWAVALDKASVRDGTLAWRDSWERGGAAPAELSIEQFALTLHDLVYPFANPLRLQGSARLTGPAGGSAGLAFEGQATDRAADLRATLDKAPLALGAPYLSSFLKPRLQGDLSAQVALAWTADGGLVVTAEQLSVSQFALATAKPTALRTLEVRDARVDVAGRSVDVGLVRIDRPRLALDRDTDGRWMFEDWLVPPDAAAPSGPQAAPWRVALRAVAVDDGAVDYADRMAARPVVLSVSSIRARAGPLRLDQRDQAVPLELSAAVASGKTSPGRLSVRGRLVPEPTRLDAELDLQQLPLHALEPYFGDALNVRLQRADTSFAGSLRYEARGDGPAVQLAGDLRVDDLRARQGAGDAAPDARARDLLTWNTLRLQGLALALAPGVPLSLAVRETALSDFYARVIVDETGRINLQDLVKSTPADTTAAPSPGPAADIRFGPITLQGGRVLFSDRLIKPNYTANLTELQGRLSAFDAASAAGAEPALADLTLSGRAEGTASLQIEGKLNPLAKPLALDIRAKVRDLELPPLSPYSVKYAGHGIERGKLSVDLHYEVLPNGQLTASNSLVLQQLTFGDPVPGAPASLPVRLATALLSDRNGVIDLNLPIQGSLNDPQFSLGPVIAKAIGNLVLKAVTAPFSLLASAFGGGGEELGHVPFAPGSAVLDPAAHQQLARVARALTDRPQLKLSVVGTVNPDTERDAIKRMRLERRVQAEKRRELLAAGQPLLERGIGAPPIEVGAEEYPALLKSLYERAEIDDKPRNAVGVAKEQSVAEMEALLLAAMQVTEESVRNLALQRSVAVRDHLAAQQVPLERLFLGAPRTVASEPGWTPRADLELTSR